MNVAIVILNWNGKEHLKTFLPSVVNHSPDVEIYLADNNSTDDSLSFVKTEFPQIKIIQNQKNHGFAAGYNEALKQIKTDVYVLLNSDVEVTENWLSPVLDQLKNDQIAACQPKIRSYTHKTKFEHAGAAGGFIDKYGYPFCRGRILHINETDDQQYDQSSEVFWATGACLFIKAELFHKAGGFDSDFFAHMEEIDLCWRLKKMGYQIWCEPKSTVYHLGGGTLNYMNPKKTLLNFRNNLFMLHKNYPGKLFPKILIRMILDGIAAMKFLMGFQFRHFTAVLNAHIQYYRSIRTLNQKRKHLKTRSLIQNVSCIYPKSIVFGFYLKGKQTFNKLTPFS